MCRDKNGRVILGSTSNIFEYSAIVAEAIALRKAVALVVSLNSSDVLFESDCMDLIEACRKNKKKKELDCIIKDIEEFSKNFNSMGFLWVNRKGNLVADMVASLASKNELNRNWVSYPPPLLMSVLDLERRACEDEDDA